MLKCCPSVWASWPDLSALGPQGDDQSCGCLWASKARLGVPRAGPDPRTAGIKKQGLNPGAAGVGGGEVSIMHSLNTAPLQLRSSKLSLHLGERPEGHQGSPPPPTPTPPFPGHLGSSSLTAGPKSTFSGASIFPFSQTDHRPAHSVGKRKRRQEPAQSPQGGPSEWSPRIGPRRTTEWCVLEMPKHSG